MAMTGTTLDAGNTANKKEQDVEAKSMQLHQQASLAGEVTLVNHTYSQAAMEHLWKMLQLGWDTRESAKIGAFGFLVVWVCYIGVNLMGIGLHSYGFFLK
ncbi:unnamed protein product [Durusdinium trenchii]|uniref:Uncharacterized protein n=1 Tax=Durusdinium trenchii TaxID=1381693 RepID=A0ABP0Q2R5_9DINO